MKNDQSRQPGLSEEKARLWLASKLGPSPLVAVAHQRVSREPVGGARSLSGRESQRFAEKSGRLESVRRGKSLVNGEPVSHAPELAPTPVMRVTSIGLTSGEAMGLSQLALRSNLRVFDDRSQGSNRPRSPREPAASTADSKRHCAAKAELARASPQP